MDAPNKERRKESNRGFLLLLLFSFALREMKILKSPSR
jgi:hypothetical protein